MSWIVRHLIKDGQITLSNIRQNFDITNDLYDDLLLVNSAIDELHLRGLITLEELNLINFVRSGGKLSSKKEKDLPNHRLSRSKKFTSICNRIAFYLGGYFTDDGYIDYIKNKYNLSDADEDAARKFMKSNYKRKSPSKEKPINDKK